MTKEPVKQANLSDLIMEKIKAAGFDENKKDGRPLPPSANPKVVEAFTKYCISYTCFNDVPLFLNYLCYMNYIYKRKDLRSQSFTN